MKLYKEKIIQIPAVEAHEETRQVHIGMECDICHEQYDNTDEISRGYDTCVVSVSYSRGKDYGADGGRERITYFDICPVCFKHKLTPFLISLGAQPQEEDSSW